MAARPADAEAAVPLPRGGVTYENKAGGVKLAGTLTLPPGNGPFPAVILITGSGAQDRDETILGHKPFLVLADAPDPARRRGAPGRRPRGRRLDRLELKTRRARTSPAMHSRASRS